MCEKSEIIFLMEFLSPDIFFRSSLVTAFESFNFILVKKRERRENREKIFFEQRRIERTKTKMREKREKLEIC